MAIYIGRDNADGSTDHSQAIAMLVGLNRLEIMQSSTYKLKPLEANYLKVGALLFSF